jgi:hypothetical protein
MVESVLRVVSMRFGPLSSKIRTAIEDAAMSGQSEKILERALRCNSLEELVSSPEVLI